MDIRRRSTMHQWSAPISRYCALLVFVCLVGPGSAQIIPGRYILILEDPPVSAKFSERADLEGSQAAAYRTQIEDKQTAVKKDLEARKLSVTGSVSALLNAIFVAAPSSRLSELQGEPGVIAVRPMRRFRPLLNRATQLMNAQAAWNLVGGITNAGMGIKIGILDTGIDQTHPAFQDPSLPMPAGFPLCTKGHPEDCAYTSNKVIVARSYVRMLAGGSNATNPAVDDEPDDYSPRDRDGHGTGVASSAAAVPTTVPGVASTGGPITIQGMAPKAYLGNYKIAGSPGVDEFASDQTLIQAVEDAVTDGMDVITTSFGSNVLSDVAGDAVATAFENAAKTGAVVTVAAGNGGFFGTISSPSNAPDAISVGATENSHVLLPAVTATAAGAPTGLKGIPAQPGDGYTYPSSEGANIAPLIDVTQLGNDGTACTALPSFSLDGAFALIKQGSCGFQNQAVNAQNAGAIGIVFYMASSAPSVFPEGLDPCDGAFIGPAVMISNAAGVALKSYIDANPGQSISIDAGGTEVDLTTWAQSVGISGVSANELTGFSSLGPTPDGQIKPDLVATGGNDIANLFPDPTDLFVPGPSGMYMATQNYDPNQSLEGGTDYSANRYWAADGTSFATPITAGAAAILKQLHSGQKLRGTQIKSMLVNSASQSAVGTDDLGDLVDAQWVGAGLLNAGAAAAAIVTAEPATVSFGFPTTGSLPMSKTITVTNIGSAAVTLTASSTCCTVNGSSSTVSGIAVSPSSLPLAAGASSTLTVTLSGSIPSPSEYSGTISLRQGSTLAAAIPFMFIVGDGQPFSVFNVGAGSGGFPAEGPPGTDVGPIIVQVIDQYGVPVTNSPVVFSGSSNGAVTLRSVAGEPACSPASSSSSTTCNTDKFGFAYAEAILGSSISAPDVSVSDASISDTAFFNIQAAPAATGLAEAAAGLTQVTPGSYAAVYGSGLSNFTDNNSTVLNFNINPSTEATDPVIANGIVLPLQIDFVTVSFDVPSAGISVPAHLTYVSPGQVNVQVPWELQGQSTAQMKVTINGDLLGNVVNVSLAAASPAFFTNSGKVVDALDSNFHLIGSGNPATRGQVVALFANGLGAVTNTPASGDPAGSSPLSKTVNTPIVMIGGQQASVGFSGLAPGYAGLYQLNVTVPANISAGTQNVTVQINGVTSPVATLPIQ